MTDRDEIINETISRLSEILGKNVGICRYEVRGILAMALDKQEVLTILTASKQIMKELTCNIYVSAKKIEAILKETVNGY